MQSDEFSKSLSTKKETKFKQSSVTPDKSYVMPFARESRRKNWFRYKNQFSKEEVKRKSKELKGEKFSNYLTRVDDFRAKRSARSQKSKQKAKLKRKDAKLAKAVENAEAEKEKKEQILAANKAALSQI